MWFWVDTVLAFFDLTCQRVFYSTETFFAILVFDYSSSFLLKVGAFSWHRMAKMPEWPEPVSSWPFRRRTGCQCRSAGATRSY